MIKGGTTVTLHRRCRAFTLIELMIVVTIIGLLAAIAIPAFEKAVRRSKSSEATINLRRIFDGALTSYQSEQVDRGGQGQQAQFPATVAPTPGENACCQQDASRCDPDPVAFKQPTWQALQFALDDPHFYWYGFISQGAGTTAAFSARASGNLDCDENYSTFERIGFVDLLGGVSGGAGIHIIDPIE